MVIKIDLSETHDKVSWLFLGLIIIHTSFGLLVVNLIEGCLNFSSFCLLVIGSASCFFNTSKLRQGYPLSPLLCLLSIICWRAKWGSQYFQKSGRLRGVKTNKDIDLSHLLFIDDVLLFGVNSTREETYLKEALESYNMETQMELSLEKSLYLSMIWMRGM